MMEEEFNLQNPDFDEYGNSLEEDDIQIYVHRPNKFEKFLMLICKFFKRLFNKCRRKN